MARRGSDARERLQHGWAGRGLRPFRVGGLLLVAALVPVWMLLAPAGAPGADSATVDFETGPPIGTPINDEYGSTAFVTWIRADPGFRPYRRTAEVATHSGTVAADISPAHCYPGEEDNPANCELATPGTLARLTKPATRVTLYAGLFSPTDGTATATLTALNGNGVEVGSTTAPMSVGITTQMTVSSSAADITSFRLIADGPAAIGAQLGFDDLTIEFPDSVPAGCNGGYTTRNDGTRVASAVQLDNLLRSGFTGRIIIPRDARWEMVNQFGQPLHDIPIGSNVELIGERGPLGERPLLYTNYRPPSDNTTLFDVQGNDVRIEGLHLRGSWPAKDHKKHVSVYFHAISVEENAETQTGRRIEIDDNEFDQWAGGGVNLNGFDSMLNKWPPGKPHLNPRDAYLVRVHHNYMHHNVLDGGGYGVVVSGDAFGYIWGNLFDYNRHAIASDGRAYNGYVAHYNYVLQGGVKQAANNAPDYYNQHFDVHGELPGGYGGFAGTRYEITYNTVRGEQTYYFHTKTRPVFMLRGRPTQGAFFRDNVVVHDDLDEAISLKPGKIIRIGDLSRKLNFHARDNHFDKDYSGELAAGDFDGDGCTDAFVANGTGWWFSRTGNRPWEFLTSSSLRTKDLGLADVDNDGITDVVFQKPGGKLTYLKRGDSPATSLPKSPVPTKDLRFGDFDGDGLTDIFYTRDKQWHVWYGATHKWTDTQTSSKKLSELLFGEFDDVPGTDVAAVTGGGWAYSSASTEPWARMNSKRADSFAKAVAADFDGNGRTDIAFGEKKNWRFSRDGRGPLITLRGGSAESYKPLRELPIGTFEGGDRAQALSFRGDDRLFIWRGFGSGNSFVVRSAQNMR